jgi:hypothetical protein
MTRTEKLLYHQVHPFKLLTDWATSFASSWLLWERMWWQAAAIAFAPSIIVTTAIVSAVDLEPYRHTPIGRYMASFMTRKIEAVRFAGQFVMWGGAVWHVPWLLPLGFLIVAYGWANGLWARK